MLKFTVRHTCLLKDFLTHSLKISGTQAKKLLDARKVFVNNQRAWLAGYKLKIGDIVEANFAPPFDSAQGTGISTSHRYADGIHSVRYEILVEDNEYIIVNKSAGIIINENKNSLENMLRRDLQNPYLQAGHRLDKDTSGAVIFAKSPEAFAALVKVFQNREVKKKYLCIVQGNVARKFPPQFTLDNPINEQSAETKVKILNSNDAASYLEVQLITGRKHQIRLHLTEAGFPILGEKMYQTKALKNQMFRQIPRQMLHAASLKFINPISGKILQAYVPEPPDFLSVLKYLKL